MSAIESLRKADLEGALEQLKNDVRDDPSNAKHRIFLFQLMCVLGDWERALTQLNVVRDLDAGALMMAQTYQEALGCEAVRADVFAGRRSPLIFGEPAAWIADLLESLRAHASGRHDACQTLRERAFESAPATSGSIELYGGQSTDGSDDDASGEEASSGESFEWIADADARLGPMLEAIVNGRYYWIPFHRVASIELERPSDLRDFVWAPAHFTWSNGGEGVGLIPTRYPGSEAHADSLVRLSKKTDWTDDGCGLGQRMLATDGGDYALLDVRRIRLDGAEGGETKETDATTEARDG